MYNMGQPSIFIKDLTGKEYPAIAEVNKKKRVNGQRELSLSFLYTEINKDFMEQIEFGWQILCDGEWYTIIHPGYSTDGDYFLVDVTAILSFFVKLNGYYLQDKAENKSITPAAYFGNLFQGTPFTYVLVDSFGSTTVSYEDNQSKTERFLYGIDRFGAEYKVNGNIVYIYEQSGNDKDVILHEDLNVNSVKIDVDASGFHTFAKGYGDLPEEGEDGNEPEYQLEVEYISPLAEKYGLIEGPAIKDGNYKYADNLTEAVKRQVENSYTVSTEIETVDLTNNGYPEMVFEEGDRIWLYISRLNLNQKVRVMEVEELKDWEGNIINARYVLGNEGIASRYKTQQYDTLKDFRDILSGKKKIGYDWLPDAVKRASEIINGNQDSLFRYGAGEIIGINQSNPNEFMRLNTDGLGFSRDGGLTYKSAITHEGINADYGVFGTLRGILIEGVEINGSIFRSQADDNIYTLIQDSYFESRGQYTRTWFGETKNHDVAFRVQDGHMRVEDFNEDKRLYYSVDGISTFIRGYDDESPDAETHGSGVIEFFSHMYDPNVRGLTLFSNRGTIGLRTMTRDIVLDAARNIIAKNNGGLFTVEGTGLRSQVIGVPEAYTNLYLGVNGDQNGEVRVTNKLFWNNGSPTYYAIRLRGVITGYNNLYLQAPDEVMAVSSGMTTWGGNHTYTAFRASEYRNGSSIEYKTNIEDLQYSGLDIINNLQVKQYILQSDVDNGNYSNWQVGLISELSPEVATQDQKAINLYKLLSYAVKAIQEQSGTIQTLEQRITDLEMVV